MASRQRLAVIMLSLYLAPLDALEIQSLDDQWKFSTINASAVVDLPQYALLSLQRQGTVGDPLYR